MINGRCYILPRVRLLSTSKFCFTSNAVIDPVLNKRGKKLNPEKTNIVVLNPKQSGLLRKRPSPNYFKLTSSLGGLSVLEGIELENNNISSKKNTCNDILNKIEQNRKKLMVFKNTVSKEQLMKSIMNLKPFESKLSPKRFQQLQNSIESAYSLPQLKQFCEKYYGFKRSNLTKKVLIDKIMKDFWNCCIDLDKNDIEDLVVEHVIDIEQKDMYLLLLTDNGRILQNFSRIGATIAVALNENKIIIRATRPISRYIEVSIVKILSNIYSEMIMMKDFIKNHTPIGLNNYKTPEQLISLVQKEGSTFFEKNIDDVTGNTYIMSSLGEKKVNKTKSLLLWAMDYKPQLIDKTILCSNLSLEKYEYHEYPLTNTEWLDWLNRDKDWYRLERIESKQSNNGDISIKPTININDSMVDELYSIITNVQNINGQFPNIDNYASHSKSMSITVGQILRTLNREEKFFQLKVPQLVSKLLALPLYDTLKSKNELLGIDQHDYFIQLSFIPDLSSVNHQYNLPPLELWFSLDDFDVAMQNTIRCINHLSERTVFLETPQLSCDFKVTMDHISDMIPLDNENPLDWIEQNQPGLKQFLDNSNLAFQSKKKLVIPKKLQLKFKIEDKLLDITYHYIKVNYRRVLRLKYLNKYLVQFTEVKGGPLGGRFTQIDFIGNDPMNREEFGQFVRDIIKFV